MRTIFTIASLFAATQALQLESGASQGEHNQFMEFLAEQGKDYSSSGQFNLRERIFVQNLRWIEAANKKSMESDDINAVMFGSNQFSDMTPHEKLASTGISKRIVKWLLKLAKRRRNKKREERKRNRGGDSESESESESSMSEASESEDSDDDRSGPVSPTDHDDSDDEDEGNVPVSAEGLDWRSYGVVNSVKNQGGCGSCWAFAAVSQLESMYAIQTGNLQLLSEQQLVDCATDGNSGCNGGFMSYVFDYFTNNKAMAYSSGYSYSAKQSTCNTGAEASQVMTQGRAAVEQSWSPAQWKAALNVSPISIAVAAGNNYFMNYQSGILDVDDCPTQIDHAVVMVGWGQDSTTGKEYWIVRNSWGTNWGEGGYIRIAMRPSGPGVCGVQGLGVTTTLK